MKATTAEPAHACLDLLRFAWASGTSEPKETCATVLEVSRSGGVFHIDESVEPGTRVTVYLAGDDRVDGEVQDLEQDQFGCYLTVRLDAPWFPVRYWPSEMLADRPVDLLKTAEAKPVDLAPEALEVAKAPAD